LVEPDAVTQWDAVDLEAAYPGAGPGGDPLVGRLSGTSGAAAEVAAMALRLRVDHPELRPDDVRSLLVQAAAPLPGVDPVDQGAGVATMPASMAPVAIDPAIISATRPPSGSASVVVALRDLTGAAARYRLAVQAADGTVTSAGTVVDLPAHERSGIAIDIPGGPGRFSGRLLVQAEDGTQVASAPIFAAPLAPTPDDALGPPVVHTSAGVTDVRVRVGLLRRSGEHLRVAPLHNLGMWLIPSGGGAPIRMVGAKEGGDWPPGTYRFVLSRRQADGRDLPAGRYRLRVMAFGSDGQPVAKDSADFRLG